MITGGTRSGILLMENTDTTIPLCVFLHNFKRGVGTSVVYQK